VKEQREASGGASGGPPGMTVWGNALSSLSANDRGASSGLGSGIGTGATAGAGAGAGTGGGGRRRESGGVGSSLQTPGDLSHRPSAGFGAALIENVSFNSKQQGGKVF
jgi:hypothetical protein